jgi:hypothetical protein
MKVNENFITLNGAEGQMALNISCIEAIIAKSPSSAVIVSTSGNKVMLQMSFAEVMAAMTQGDGCGKK